MKKIGLIFAVCLAFTGLCTVHAENISDATRATVRRTTSGGVSTASRQQSNDSLSVTRGNNATTPHTTQSVRGRANTVQNRTQSITERKPNATSRNAGNVVSRGTTTGTVAARTTNTSRSGITRTNTKGSSGAPSRAISRSATDTVTREDVLNRNYSKCKTVFFDCMDEFCANKDSQLKRCACSSRVNEFDSIKKQLEKVEDKMLDFNQRLLTVNMDKEDATALSIATEGEKAYLSTKDGSDSKKTLDAIATKLKTNFDTSVFSNDFNILSYSLDADSAFDNVDSLRGASTTTKTGTALYSAALPVCRQMAAEVCAKSDISLAEGGYAALIEQDCNTVAKTYQTQTAQARSKVLEGGALLDMSRLDVYQKRNSDDILTCKKKMLDMLSDSTVCGPELSKCLDTTGRYIDPSTGDAYLTNDLVNLGNLLTRPVDGSTWTSTGQNSVFVSFLDSKKKFLEPATENCQVIADDVWAAFVEDALAQIKLAQDKKLDTIRQSCTVLTSQCLSDAATSIKNFDSRALSTFGIDADRTTNAMCNDIIDSCNKLLTVKIDDEEGSENAWSSGINEITNATTYETLMQTCRQVGRSCIIQACTSISGNFGLCENISTSVNRKSIINRTACWDDVKNCIARAGSDAINNIIEKHLGINDDSKDWNFYTEMYGSTTIATDGNTTSSCITNANSNCVYDICTNDCKCDGAVCDKTKCRICRLAERIWGNCEVAPTTVLSSLYSNINTQKTISDHNKIKSVLDDNEQSLLYWFAVNTGTERLSDSCRDTSCPVGYTNINGVCIKDSDMCFAGPGYDTHGAKLTSCDVNDNSYMSQITYSNDKIPCVCCNTRDTAGNCCASGATITETLGKPFDNHDVTFCVSGKGSDNNGVVITEPYKPDENFYNVLICDGGTISAGDNFVNCSGTLVNVLIKKTGDNNYKFYYSSPTNDNFVKNQIKTNVTGLTYTLLPVDYSKIILEFCSTTIGVDAARCRDAEKTLQGKENNWRVIYPE